MRSIWKVRDGYFSGRAGTYVITDPSGEKISIHVDERGYFDLDRPPFHAIGIFAKLAIEVPHPVSNASSIH